MRRIGAVQPVQPSGTCRDLGKLWTLGVRSSVRASVRARSWSRTLGRLENQPSGVSAGQTVGRVGRIGPPDHRGAALVAPGGPGPPGVDAVSSSADIIACMASTIIAAIAALVGVGLGQFLTRTFEHRRWYRQELHVVCVRLLVSANAGRTESARDAAVRQVLKKGINSPAVRDVIHQQLGIRGLLERFQLLDSPEFLAALDDQLVAITEPVFQDRFGRNEILRVEKAQEIFEQMNSSIAAVRLLAPKSVADAGARLVSATMALQVATTSETETKAAKEYTTARDSFIGEARMILIPRSKR